ncbi:hypothetical protein [Lacipirellula parvula]|uniref:Cytidyltransferase-like domain-containing protein n=1 Tax=Lacipirellula parvula TaxID=2650471 RepID=A0A5K7X565_9BACT|nr:hypothetical protein [Lacipirellula parvula]BBO30972.1 hypothetical protein PLANPX_0584 [Lacipirellula parvula]
MATVPDDSAVAWPAVAAQIHASGRQMVLAVTGGGTGAVSALLQTPGASRTMLEAVVPYAHAALVDWIGAMPEQACSAATARAMAMASFMRARELAPTADQRLLLGVGATASLATDRPKLGGRRIHVAWQSAEQTWVESYCLADIAPNRADDERASTSFLLWIIAGACGVKDAKLYQSLPTSRQDELLQVSGGRGELPQQELLMGKRRLAVLKAESSFNYFPESESPAVGIVFPGAFNPPHAGHLRMMEIAEQRVKAPAAWELSITNVDKLPLDFMSMKERITAIRASDDKRLVALTRAPTFREKSELFPRATFVVGIDTLARIAEPRYYDGDEVRRDAAIAEIAAHGCRFLAFGRMIEGKFTVLSDLELPPALTAICDEVSAGEFREDVSSSELRSMSADA